MIDSLLESWSLIDQICRDGFIAALALAVAAPWIGTLLVMRRMPFLGLAIPQLAGAGTALAWVIFPLVSTGALTDVHEHDHPPSAFLLVAATLAIIGGLSVLALVTGRDRATSAQAALLYLGALATAEVAWVMGPYAEMAEGAARSGRLLTVLSPGRDRIVIAAALTLIITLIARRPLWSTAFDPDLARLQGRSPSRWLFITLLLAGAPAAVAVPEIGPDAVLALLLIPPALLNRAAPSLALYGPLCALAGVCGVVMSFHLSMQRDWPLNPALILGLLGSSACIAGLARLVHRLRTTRPRV